MLDKTDLLILDELSQNSRISMQELGKRVHLTGAATSNRVSKLEENGIIEAYTIKVNQVELGDVIHCLISIWTKSVYHESYLSYIKTQEKYVMNNYKISGDSCYLLECRFPSQELLEEFLVGLNRHVTYKMSIVMN